MVKKSAFALRKDEMYDFLKDNISYIAQQENIFLTREHAIYAVSQQEEFFKLVKFKKDNDTKKVDIDRDNLQELHKRVINFIVHHNDNDIIPGFILLQSETDFIQAKKEKRIDTIVNKWGFNQQILESETSSKTFFDKRKLKPLEVALLSMMQVSTKEKIHIPHKGFYERELNLYNPNKGLLEINTYKNNSKVDPIFVTSLDSCYYCHRVENHRDDHAKCKKTDIYRDQVIERNKERYHRNIFIQGQRKNSIELDAITLDKDYLQKVLKKQLHKDTYQISVIK